MPTTGVIFSSFDFHKGPIVIYQHNLSDNLALKVSQKVIFAALSGHSSIQAEDFITGESIVPFPEEKKLVFSYFFPFVDSEIKGDNVRASALSIVSDTQDNIMLYQLAHKLLKKAKFIAELIQKEYSYASEKLSEKVISKILELEQIIPSLKKEIVIREFEEIRPFAEPSLSFIYEYQRKEFDRVLEALITNDKIIIIAPDKGLAVLVSVTLSLFTPHRALKTHYWTSIFTDDGDIFCGPNDLLSNIPEASQVVVLDLTKKTVSGGKRNSHLEKIFFEFAEGKLDADTVKLRLQEIIDNWLVDVGAFLSITSNFLGKPTNETQGDITKFYNSLRNQYSASEMEILGKLMMARNPGLTLRAKELLLVGKDIIDTLKETLIDKIGPVGTVITSKIISKSGFKVENFPRYKIPELITKIIEEISSTGIMEQVELRIMESKMRIKVDDLFLQLSKTVL